MIEIENIHDNGCCISVGIETPINHEQVLNDVLAVLKTKKYFKTMSYGEQNDCIEDWHYCESQLPIYEYLGLSYDEYASWVKNPDVFSDIISDVQQLHNAKLTFNITNKG